EAAATGSCDSVAEEIYDFLMERLRAYYLERSGDAATRGEATVTTEMFDAVLAARPASPLVFDARLKALSTFLELPESASLIAANKRIANILRKANMTPPAEVDVMRLREDAEVRLFDSMRGLRDAVAAATAQHEYAGALGRLAQLRPAVDAFFDSVMVMDEDHELRARLPRRGRTAPRRLPRRALETFLVVGNRRHDGALPAPGLGAQARVAVGPGGGTRGEAAARDCDRSHGGPLRGGPGHRAGQAATRRGRLGHDLSRGHTHGARRDAPLRRERHAARERGWQAHRAGGAQRRVLLAAAGAPEEARHGARRDRPAGHARRSRRARDQRGDPGVGRGHGAHARAPCRVELAGARVTGRAHF